MNIDKWKGANHQAEKPVPRLIRNPARERERIVIRLKQAKEPNLKAKEIEHHCKYRHCLCLSFVS